MSDGWDIAGVFVGGISALLVAASVVYAAKQVYYTRRSYEATTIYNLEKDFTDRFKVVSDAGFRKCFVSDPKQNPDFNIDNRCMDSEARASFYDLLGFYRLLVDLQDHGSLNESYVSARFKAGCSYLASRGGRDTTKFYASQHLISEAVTSRVDQQCGAPK
jgi:hypothetical protein